MPYPLNLSASTAVTAGKEYSETQSFGFGFFFELDGTMNIADTCKPEVFNSSLAT
jgi:hypothetical protein